MNRPGKTERRKVPGKPGSSFLAATVNSTWNLAAWGRSEALSTE
ncbi:MAG: hypothetical protein PHR72_08620 [Synergistales bacterium]|nr:hypothetical protein [Synergistales bacterium]